MFGYPGGAILPVYDALRKYPIRHILVRHEQGAAHAADGYARASGKVGVAIATSGPGATNLVTGIATAMMDSVPLVCITGQVSSKLLGTDAFQEVDITGITLPITKHNYVVTRAAGYRPGAFAKPSSSPAPAVPARSWWTSPRTRSRASPISISPPPRPRRTVPHPMLSAEQDAITEALELILSAKRPVILAGHGMHGIQCHGPDSHSGRAPADSRGLHPARPRRLPRLARALASA